MDLNQGHIELKAITEGDAVSIMRKMNKIRKQFDENYTNEDIDEKGLASTRNSPLKGRMKGKGAKVSAADEGYEIEKNEESEKYAAFRN